MLTYRQMKEKLERIPEEHLNDNVSILLLDSDEILPVVDFIETWPLPQYDEESLPTGDYEAMHIYSVQGILDDNHPFMTIVF